MIIATTTEYGIDEDTETCSRVTRSICDNFMMRPSLKDHAIQAIASMANNDLAMVQGKQERPLLFDAAFVFIDQGQARFLISGCAAAYHFHDGRLAHRSDPAEASAIGSGANYSPRMEDAFELGSGKNAFLTASRRLATAISDEAIEASLKGTETPEQWMRALRELVGADAQFCAIAAFLPTEKPSILKTVFRR